MGQKMGVENWKEMAMKENNEGKEKKKGFLAEMFEKLDKKMEEKAKENKCCCSSDKDKSCCS